MWARRPAPLFCRSRGVSTTGSRPSPAKDLVPREPVPEVMVSFGNPPAHMTFLSHPGVMCISKLLEMKYIVSPRARLTQENVDAIREFDGDLADKCQLAVNAGIDVNFIDIEHLDRPEFLQRFLAEKELLEAARAETLAAGAGDYRIPYYARTWEKPAVPRKWRGAEANITAEMLHSEPDLVKDLDLQAVVAEYLRKKPQPPPEDDFFGMADDPVRKAGDQERARKIKKPHVNVENATGTPEE